MANHRGVKLSLRSLAVFKEFAFMLLKPPSYAGYRCMSNSAKQKVNMPKTEWQMAGVTNRIYRSLHTISHFPVLLSVLVDTHCHCCDSD